MPDVRYKLTIAYRGTRYHGWQQQSAEHAPDVGGVPRAYLPTVQETLRRVMTEVLRHPLVLQGSSRTDAGVHARGQVAHFDTPHAQIPPENLRRAINARLPGDIVVRAIEAVPATFHAIRSTLHKRYEYLVRSAPERDAFDADTSFWRPMPIDVEAMREAAAGFVGTHDFAAFAKPGHGRETTVRTVLDASVDTRDLDTGRMIRFRVTGTGFLWNQVRIMAGTLIEVGIGKYGPGQIAEMIQSRDRTKSGSTAPAHGLYLDEITFGESDRSEEAGLVESDA